MLQKYESHYSGHREYLNLEYSIQFLYKEYKTKVVEIYNEPCIKRQTSENIYGAI